MQEENFAILNIFNMHFNTLYKFNSHFGDPTDVVPAPLFRKLR